MVAHAGWQALFACTSVIALVLSVIAAIAIPEKSGLMPAETHGDAHFWPYLIFAAAIGALQIAMQQVRFELFTSSPGLIALSLLGLADLAWFANHQWYQPKPLVKLHAMRDRTFQTGLVMYMFFYYISNAVGFLISRMLEGGLGYPVENAGRLVGFTALAALPLVFVYFHYSPKIQRKKLIIVPGYLIVIAVCTWLSKMPPDVSANWLVAPLFLRGALLLTMALPVANVTFSIFPLEEYNHGYRIKNIVKQLTLSFSTATIIMIEQHRSALHYTRLAETVDQTNQAIANAPGLASSGGTSIGQLFAIVQRQADLMSVQDGFIYLTVIASIAGLFATLQRKI